MTDKLTIQQIASGFKTKQFSAVELTKNYLQAIKQDKFNCFITVNEEVAVQQAAVADEIIARGEQNVLTGLPLAVKDVLVTKGLKTTAGSKILQNYIPPYNATVVEKLLSKQIVILGKANCDEFAMGASNENSAYGNVLNPLDTSRVPGGSSGGSAAAVTANLAPIALGTDTGGSVRQPAAFCGVVGLKPTYGRVSRYGLISMASSLDVVGVLANTVEDSALLLENLAGQDDNDNTTIGHPVDDYFQATTSPLRPLTVGLPKQYFIPGTDERIIKLIEQAVEKLKKQGIKVKSIDLPYSEYALAAYYIIMPSEVSSNMGRFDGLRYGLQVKGDDLIDQYNKTRSAGFGDEVRRRILLGTFALSHGYYDAYYLQAQKVRTLIKQDFDKAFGEVDAVITPTTPSVAFKLGEKADPLTMYLADIFTVSANIAGLPGISLPVGTVDGLPAGLQILGPAWSESTILNLAYNLQQLLELKK